MLRRLLQALGLSAAAADEVVEKVLELLSGKEEPQREPEYPYRLSDGLLSPAELSFYLVLTGAVRDWAVVCPKVGLGELFTVPRDDYAAHVTYTNKIDRKHVDFVLCDPRTMRPLVGLELDDRSHRRRDRQERDEFVEHVFAAAGLPLARVPAKWAYQPAELNRYLREQAGLGGAEDAAPSEPSVGVDRRGRPSPACPKCGADMVLRTARSGPNQGKQFWGCSSYPVCRGILPVEPSH